MAEKVLLLDETQTEFLALCAKRNVWFKSDVVHELSISMLNMAMAATSRGDGKTNEAD